MSPSGACLPASLLRLLSSLCQGVSVHERHSQGDKPIIPGRLWLSCTSSLKGSFLLLCGLSSHAGRQALLCGFRLHDIIGLACSFRDAGFPRRWRSSPSMDLPAVFFSLRVNDCRLTMMESCLLHTPHVQCLDNLPHDVVWHIPKPAVHARPVGHVLNVEAPAGRDHDFETSGCGAG